MFAHELHRPSIDNFTNEKPYSHCRFETFFNDVFASNVANDFAEVDWQHAVHVNENKFWNRTPCLPNHLSKAVMALHSPQFLQYLTSITGIEGLIPDNELLSGGVHRTGRNGFLNIHADFTVHPNYKNLERRLNLLVYLTPNWIPEWGGDLELWDSQMTAKQVSYSPIFNSAILFATAADSFHGCPSPLRTPDGVFRHSIALYYYTEHKGDVPIIATNYKAKPTDSLLKRSAIFVDSWFVSIFHRLKSRFGLTDRFFTFLFDFKNKK